MDPATVADTVSTLVQGLYTEPAPATGVSRSDLQPVGTSFTRNRILAFALDFLQLESELIDAVFSIPATSDRNPLPAIVSKEISVLGANVGRGGFNRVHTAFHPTDAVVPDDVRLVDPDYLEQLFEWYVFLFDQINATEFFIHSGHVTFATFAQVARVKTPRDAHNRVLRYEAEPALRLRVPDQRWGTMRRRGAHIRH